MKKLHFSLEGRCYMQFDVPTVLFVSSCITAAVSLSILFFTLAKRENHQFIWAVFACACFAGGMFLSSYRNGISDGYNIIVGNTLAVLALLAFYQLFCEILLIASKNWMQTILLLFFQITSFIWFTYFQPSFTARVLIMSIVLGLISAKLIRLLWKKAFHGQRLFHFLASIPFVLLLCFSLIRIALFLWSGKIEASEFSASGYAVAIIFYCIIAICATLSAVFIVSNQLQLKLVMVAMTDPLTGVMNRRALEGAIGRVIAKTNRDGSPLSLIIIDLDHFKRVNDTYGHQAGDAILVHVISLFQQTVREYDLLSRLGGEEFLIVLPDSGLEEARRIAERCRNVVKSNVLVFESRAIPITCSFGVAGYERNATGFEGLVKQADEALYQAKEEGRDRVVLFKPN